MDSRDPFVSRIGHVVTVTGGRDYRDARVVARELFAADPDLVIHGGATGADTLADRWAIEHGVPRLILAVHDRHWRRYGKIAGRLRNEALASLAAQLVAAHDPSGGSFGIAFPGGNGTAHMLGEMVRRGLTMYDLRDVEDIR